MSCPFPLPEQRHIHSNPESQVGQSPRTPESPSGWARTGVRVSWLAPPPFRHTLLTTNHPCGPSRRQCAFFLVISNSGVTRTQRMIDREEGTRVWPERRPHPPPPQTQALGRSPLACTTETGKLN